MKVYHIYTNQHCFIKVFPSSECHISVASLLSPKPEPVR